MKLFKFTILLLWSVSLLQISHGLKTKPNKTKSKAKVPNKPKNPSPSSRVVSISSLPKNTESLSITVLQIVIEEENLSEVVTPISIPKNGEIVVGRDTIGESRAKLILQCSAPYPVQWIYSGDGNPEITANSTLAESPSTNRVIHAYIANAGLGFNGALRETDTGEYICKRVQINKNWQKYSPQFASLYIYVPGTSLFIQKTGESLYPPKDSNWVRIPCAVTSPDVIVTLQKNDNGFLQCPSGHEVRFSPKSGFIVASQISVRGKYVCIGSLNGTHQQLQLVEYVVQSSSEVDKKKEKKVRQKQKKVKAALFLRDSESSSGTGFIKQPYYAQEDDDDNDYFEDEIHPRNEGASCYPSNPCGPNSVCKTTQGKAPIQKCTCRVGFMGRPPNCRPECTLNIDCPSNMECVGHRCSDPCNLNRCGLGAMCTVVDHSPKCKCPPGHIGNPERNGKCGRSRGPSLHYFPVPFDPMSESQFGSSYPFMTFGGSSSEESSGESNSLPEVFQNRFPCDPWPCGPNSQCRPVGENAHCTCSVGYMGTPPNCRPECTRNSHCSTDLACIELKCRSPCAFTEGKCGFRAMCRTINHTPSCFCPRGFDGDPFVKCRPQRQQPGPEGGQRPFPDSPSSSMDNSPFPPISRPPHSQQQQQYPSMTMRPNRPGGSNTYPTTSQQEEFPQISPCTNSPCGKNAICSSRNETVGCKCPPSLSGYGSDPYVECYPSSNPCEVCGPFSKCIANRGGGPPHCSCIEGKVGSPPNCRDGFCQKNRECDDNQHCHGGRCDDPCKRANCGRNAVCRGMRHHAVCACRNAPDRDPLFGCPPKIRYKENYDDDDDGGGNNSEEYYIYFK